MIVKEIKDLEDAREIMFNPSILALLEDDDNKINYLPVKDCKYIGCYIENRIVGFVMYELVNGLNYAHICMLEGYRGSTAMRFARKAINFRVSDIIYTNMDESLKHIANFASGFGFKLYKTINNAIKKDGIKLDLLIYKLDLSGTE